MKKFMKLVAKTEIIIAIAIEVFITVVLANCYVNYLETLVYDAVEVWTLVFIFLVNLVAMLGTIDMYKDLILDKEDR